MKRLPLLCCALSCCLLGTRLWAAETAPSTAPESTMSTAPSASTNSASPAAEVSFWLQSFPAERKRQLADRTLVIWPPHRLWRGDVVMLPGVGNAVQHNGPLLQLADRLAQAGWRCWLLARDQQAKDGQVSDGEVSLTADLLSQIKTLVAAEPPPPLPAEHTNRLPPFAMAQADATALAWSEATAEHSAFAGVILLGADQLPELAPKLPVLELQIAEQAAGAAAAAQSRQARWQYLGQYQQQALLSSSRLPSVAWLGNAIDGWLRKIANQQTHGTDDSMKRQMTAQPTPGTPN